MMSRFKILFTGINYLKDKLTGKLFSMKNVVATVVATMLMVFSVGANAQTPTVTFPHVYINEFTESYVLMTGDVMVDNAILLTNRGPWVWPPGNTTMAIVDNKGDAIDQHTYSTDNGVTLRLHRVGLPGNWPGRRGEGAASRRTYPIKVRPPNATDDTNEANINVTVFRQNKAEIYATTQIRFDGVQNYLTYPTIIGSGGFDTGFYYSTNTDSMEIATIMINATNRFEVKEVVENLSESRTIVETYVTLSLLGGQDVFVTNTVTNTYVGSHRQTVNKFFIKAGVTVSNRMPIGVHIQTELVTIGTQEAYYVQSFDNVIYAFEESTYDLVVPPTVTFDEGIARRNRLVASVVVLNEEIVSSIGLHADHQDKFTVTIVSRVTDSLQQVHANVLVYQKAGQTVTFTAPSTRTTTNVVGGNNVVTTLTNYNNLSLTLYAYGNDSSSKFGVLEVKLNDLEYRISKAPTAATFTEGVYPSEYVIGRITVNNYLVVSSVTLVHPDQRFGVRYSEINARDVEAQIYLKAGSNVEFGTGNNENQDFHFTLTAYDMDSSATPAHKSAILTVSVTEPPNSPPRISVSNFTITINEKDQVSLAVIPTALSVSVFDLNAGDTADLTVVNRTDVRLYGTNDDYATLQIMPRAIFDYEDERAFLLTIAAIDSVNNNGDQVEITVIIKDIPDAPIPILNMDRQTLQVTSDFSLRIGVINLFEFENERNILKHDKLVTLTTMQPEWVTRSRFGQAIFTAEKEDIPKFNGQQYTVTIVGGHDHGGGTVTKGTVRFTIEVAGYKLPEMKLNGTISLNPYENEATSGAQAIGVQVVSDKLSNTQISLDHSGFYVDSNKSIILSQGVTFDYEATDNGNLVVSVYGSETTTRAAAPTITTSFTLVIQDDNDEPVIANQIVQQTAVMGRGFTITFPANTFSDMDDNAVLSYTANKPDWLNFDGDSRTFSVNTITADLGTYPISLIATDSGESSALAPRLAVTMMFNLVVDDAPVISVLGEQLTINEGLYKTETPTGLRITATDVDGVTATLLSGDSKFALKTNGSVVIMSNADIDFETDRSYVFTITATDNVNAFVTTQKFTISITDVLDEAPRLVRTGNLRDSIEEGDYHSGLDLGVTYSASDPDPNNNLVTISLVANDVFELAGTGQTNRQLRLVSTSFDYETMTSHVFTLTVIATDSGGNTDMDTIQINITDRKEALALRSTIPTITVVSGEIREIRLDGYFVTDTGGRLAFTHPQLPNLNFVEVSASEGRYRITAPVVPQNETHVVSMTVKQNYSSTSLPTTTINFDLNILFQVREFTHVSDVVLPRILDAVSKQSTGAVANRIARIAARDYQPWNRELLAAVQDNAKMFESGDINIYQLLANRDFFFGFHDGDISMTNLGLWARLDFNQFEGNDISNVTYDGEMMGFSSGMDYRFVNGGILGLAIGHHTGELDFSHKISSDYTRVGTYEVALNVVQPYYSGSLAMLDYWVSFGLGEGEVDIKENAYAPVYNNDLEMFLTAAGIDSTLYEYSTNAKVAAFAEVAQSEMTLKPVDSHFSETDTSNTNLRAGMNFQQKRDTTTGSLIGKLGVAIVRQNSDGGALERSDSGHEIFTEFSYLLHNIPLKVNGDFRYLFINSSDQKYLSGGLLVNFRNSRSSRLGAFMDINPAYRRDSSDSLFALGDFGTNTNDIIGDPRMVFSTNLGYGIGIPGGILTPYGNYLLEQDKEDYSLGLRYNTADRFTLGLGLNRNNDSLDETKFELQYKIIN